MIYRTKTQITSAELNELFSLTWGAHDPRDFAPILKRSLVYVCAYRDGVLTSAGDRPPVGVRHAAEEVDKRGMECLHVYYESHLEGFYEACGFRPTNAGLMKLGNARGDW